MKPNGVHAVEDSPSARKFSKVPPSPPPLRREPSSGLGRSDISPDLSLNGRTPTTASESSDRGARLSGSTLNGSAAPADDQPTATPHVEKTLMVLNKTPQHGGRSAIEWSAAKIVQKLEAFQQEIKNGHAELVQLFIQSSQPTDRRRHSGPDLFASLDAKPVEREHGKTMRIKFKVSNVAVD